MSISRKNWSALSSLTRQWTMEDEEEVERERRRRRGKSSSSSADPDTPRDTPTGDTPTGDTPTRDTPTRDSSPGLSSEEQMQLDFVEMLRLRDEKRRLRHVETLRRQKKEEDDDVIDGGGGAEDVGGGVKKAELRGGVSKQEEEEENGVFPPVTASKPQPPQKTASSNGSDVTDAVNRRETAESPIGKEPDPRPGSGPGSRPARKFVSSVSISLDKSPSVSGHSTPMSPRSPAAPLSPRQHWPSSCQSPSPGEPRSPVQNGHTPETDRTANGEQTSRPALVRQSSRTVSFRLIKKKEGESSPLRRSSSVRIAVATKKFETNTDQNEDEEKSSSFVRNSRQRISSRSIQEKVDRLAQAAHKSETTRSPDVSQRTLVLMEEVSRKRGIFEKDEDPSVNNNNVSSSSGSRQSLRSGMSDRINRWISKTNQSGPANSPTTDVRHVDISSKRSLFENPGQNHGSSSGGGGFARTGNIYK